MNQPESIQVANTRVAEIFQGKAASTIKDLMVENAQLSAVAEALHQQLAEAQGQVRELKVKLSEATMPVPSAPAPAPPQDTV